MPPNSPLSTIRVLSRLASSTPQARLLSARTTSTIQRPTSYPKPNFKPLLSLRYNSTSPFTSSPPNSRQESSESSPLRPLTDRQPNSQPISKSPRQPEYELTFTCKPCKTRSTHKITKQGYHHGSVLITCPECRNRHVISDHLNIFGDRNLTIEDLMREQGQIVKKGTLSEDGNIEFWADGSNTARGQGAGVDSEGGREEAKAAAGTKGGDVGEEEASRKDGDANTTK